jgi:hypothetical protein
MRKEWIRTDEERRLRELIKFDRQQNKLHHGCVDRMSMSMVTRRKKRLTLRTMKPTEKTERVSHENNCHSIE